jgi:rubrerythrin
VVSGRARLEPLTRRRLLHRTALGAGAGSAWVLGGCGDDTKSPFAATLPDESDDADVELLNLALDLELEAVAAYKAAAGMLRGDALAAAKRFVEHEQEHASRLTAAIREAGGKPNRPRRSYDFPPLRSQQDALRFAISLEDVAIAAYIDLLPKLGRGELRATAAAIVANEAEHVAVLRTALGEEPVPAAFVVGSAG